jgi:DNA-binding NtrC family response regulator
VEDLSPRVQRLLLGVIDTGRFHRVGSGTDAHVAVPFNARLVATAQPGVEQRTGSADGLRRDLFAHLSGVLVRVPPLREYAEDVPDLLRFYVERIADAEKLPLRRFSVAAQNRLRNYPWPGNLRELRSLVRRMLARGGTEEISLDEIEIELQAHTPPNEPLVKQDLLALPLREAREQFERAYLQQQLLLCNGKVGQLAKRVGMERTHLYRKLRSLGVEFRPSNDE